MIRSLRGASALRLVASCLVVLGLLLAPSVAGAKPKSPPDFRQDPVIFVHGFVGSGAQFESQKMRFTSNGYPGRWIAVLEYDSTFATETRQQVHTRLDQLIAELKRETGRTQVDLVGHSLGTSVSQDYLNSSPERAGNVAHYVNIDGREADAPPGGVPTLAIWAGRGAPGRSIEGAENVTVPNQTHVQSATSPETFALMHRFFTGKKPRTTDIVAERGPITIAGRALFFPHNRGLTATAVEVWPLDHATGHRIGATPAATAPVAQDGSWGPVGVEPGQYYELALVRPGVAMLHYYYEPFIRSDHLVRLLYSDAVETLVQRSENHVSALVIRYKELWGDQEGENDSITFNGVEACNPATCPISKQVNAMFVYDRGLDGQTDTSSPDPAFSRLPFITGVDIFMPAARPPTGTVSVSLESRGGGGVRTLTFPNFPSTTDGAVLQFNDFEQG
jgi:pimeloyl-ACP methyl ester carboxylesterase